MYDIVKGIWSFSCHGLQKATTKILENYTYVDHTRSSDQHKHSVNIFTAFLSSALER
jgi:hypothetical protein